MSKLISIITPTYNARPYIEETILSVLNQSYSNWEMLITDDGSTDGTWVILKKYSRKDHRIKIFKIDKNSGPGIARNNSIKNANGQYLTFIDSDDLWESDFLEKSINFLNNNYADFVFSSYFRKNENLSVDFKNFIVPSIVSYNDVLNSCPILCSTAFINIERLGKKYMPDLKKRQDAALWLKYLKETDYAFGIKEPLATYRIRKNSLSYNKIKVIKYQWQLYRISEKISILKSLFFLSLWAFNGILKYINQKYLEWKFS